MRSYKQFCPAARALEIVGERWTLLVVRELLVGPKRYTDLQEELPGIGPNVLADRLRTLESAGVARRTRLPRPAASTVYELTDLGAGLRPVLRDLFQWGLQLLDTPAGDEMVKVSYWLPAIEAAARSAAVPEDLNEVYEFRVDDESITVAVRDGEIDVMHGPAPSPDLLVRTNAATLARLGRGHISARDANDSGDLTFDGDAAVAERCAALFATVASVPGA